MDKKLWVIAGLTLALAGCGITGAANDATSVVQAAQRMMGNPTSIQYSGTGMFGRYAVAYAPGGEWPRRELSMYNRAINYEQRSSKAEWKYYGRAPWTPASGGENQYVSGDTSWIVGANGTPNPIGSPGSPQVTSAGGQHQLDIWMTPHGFLKAALAAGNATVSQTGDTKVVSFKMGKYPLKGTIDANNLVTSVETLVGISGASLPGGPYGDMKVVANYSGYKDFNGVKFPMTIQVLKGEYPLWELEISSVTPNAPVDIPVPEAAKNATIPANFYGQDAKPVKMAEGVWFAESGRPPAHNQLIMEFDDFVAITEAPYNDQRTMATLELVKQLTNKPVRYVISTGHYPDHTGGLRGYVSHGGVTIVTHDYNVRWLNKVLVAPSTIAPDMQEMHPGKPNLLGVSVNKKWVLTDGKHTLEVYATEGDNHLNNRVLIYLPQHKLLVADEIPPPEGDVLSDDIRRFKLNVDTILPVHEQEAIPMAQFKKMLSDAEAARLGTR